MIALLEKKYMPAVVLLLLTFFSFLVAPGYESFTSDQTMFLPPLFHTLDASLFPNNDLAHARLLASQRSLINDMLEFFVKRGGDMLWVLFLLSIAFRVFFFTALYHIILYFTENRSQSIFMLFFFLTAFFVPGTGHLTIESAFTYRTVALSLSLLYLALYLHGWWLVSLIPLIGAFTIHALTALPFFFFHYLYTARNAWQSPREKRVLAQSILLVCIPALAVLLFLWWRQSGATDSFFLRMDTEWMQLANPRNAPAFFAFWDIRSYISLVLWLLLGSIPLLYIKKLFGEREKQIILLILLLIPLCMLLIAAIGEFSRLHGIIKINLQRGLFLISFFVPILVGIFALWHAEDKRNEILKNTFLFAILLSFLFKIPFRFEREPILFFMVPLLILFYGPCLPYIKEKTHFFAVLAIAAFALIDGTITMRALSYLNIYPLILFHLTLLGAWCMSLLYAKQYVSSSVIVQYGIAVAIPFLIITSLFFLKAFTIYPAFSYNTPYMEACAWIEQHTAPDSIFIVEPFVANPPPEEFRLACFRPIFTTYKEGGVVPYDENRDVAFAWKKRYDLIYALKKDLTLLERIKQEYRLDYVLSETPLALSTRHPLVFSNQKYYIYDIR